MTGAESVAASSEATGAAAAAATGVDDFSASAEGEGEWLKDIRKSVAALSSSAAELMSRVQVCKAEKASSGRRNSKRRKKRRRQKPSVQIWQMPWRQE